MNYYAVLGLEDDESNQRIIKCAYAQLLKQHRPDQDPEGFRRIHDAYKWVIAGTMRVTTEHEKKKELTTVREDNQQQGVASSSTVNETKVELQPTTALIDLWTVAVSELEQAKHAEPSPESIALVVSCIRELTNMYRDGLGNKWAWIHAVTTAAKQNFDLLEAAMAENDLRQVIGQYSLADLMMNVRVWVKVLNTLVF